MHFEAVRFEDAKFEANWKWRILKGEQLGGNGEAAMLISEDSRCVLKVSLNGRIQASVRGMGEVRIDWSVGNFVKESYIAFTDAGHIQVPDPFAKNKSKHVGSKIKHLQNPISIFQKLG